MANAGLRPGKRHKAVAQALGGGGACRIQRVTGGALDMQAQTTVTHFERA
jgi:glycosyltransferase A (GT-A) superfamily protein (DUF2064 family)